jgi:hypothetical protein
MATVLNKLKITFDQGKKEAITLDALDFIFNSSGSGNIRQFDTPNGVVNLDIRTANLELKEVETTPVAEAPAEPTEEKNQEQAQGAPEVAEPTTPAEATAEPVKTEPQPQASKKGGKGK